jgi:glycosyltransferase involved in cell wall biosynthesis
LKNIAILGTVGIPASYGGFETLAENLAKFHHDNGLSGKLVVYCSAKGRQNRLQSYLGAELRYVGLYANGVSSIAYDFVSLFLAVLRRSDVILLLGVSGAIALPLLRLMTRTRIVTNIDGVEWKREKWKGLARWFLHLSERIAVQFSHEVIADNGGIAAHVAEAYGRKCHVIAYGGDHALRAQPKPYEGEHLPSRYALALCRIEPENNVDMILDTFAIRPEMPLVFVGNWNSSDYSRSLRQRYASFDNLHLLDPIYDLDVLYTVRNNAAIYVHGHSAGGTNPSLVEMMHFGVPILAYDCTFNRHTTDEKALWFKDAGSLGAIVASLTPAMVEQVGSDMKRIAQERYTWRAVGQEYFSLLTKDDHEGESV